MPLRRTLSRAHAALLPGATSDAFSSRSAHASAVSLATPFVIHWKAPCAQQISLRLRAVWRGGFGRGRMRRGVCVCKRRAASSSRRQSSCGPASQLLVGILLRRRQTKHARENQSKKVFMSHYPIDGMIYCILIDNNIDK